MVEKVFTGGIIRQTKTILVYQLHVKPTENQFVNGGRANFIRMFSEIDISRKFGCIEFFVAVKCPIIAHRKKKLNDAIFYKTVGHVYWCTRKFS